MDKLNVPYKASTLIETYEGDWTAEQIARGEAGNPKTELYSDWYEPVDGEMVLVTDPERIRELEASVA